MRQSIDNVNDSKTIPSKHLGRKKREKGFSDGILTCTITENNMNNAFFIKAKMNLPEDFIFAQYGCYLLPG